MLQNVMAPCGEMPQRVEIPGLKPGLCHSMTQYKGLVSSSKYHSNVASPSERAPLQACNQDCVAPPQRWDAGSEQRSSCAKPQWGSL